MNDRRSRRRAIFVAVSLCAILAAPPTHAFQYFRHSNMTGEVLGRQGVSGNVLSFIQQGVRWPDVNQCVVGCYCPEIVFWCTPVQSWVEYVSPFHYDNNRLSEGMQHVELWMGIARQEIAVAHPPTNDAERRALGEGFIDFGIALHAIQDFYAHSTWVELNHDLVRIGGNIGSAPLWNGEDNWGTGTCDVGGVQVAGVQTGYERLPTPPGSVTHSALNKDHGNTAQGQKVVNRIFPSGVIGSYYEIASGQSGVTGGSYKDAGLAPRHTIKAWQCLQNGNAVYQLPPGPSQPADARRPSAQRASAMDFASVVAWINSDPGMSAAAASMNQAFAAANPDSPQTYPTNLFDEAGWPLPSSTRVEEGLHPSALTLDRAWPNPFRGSVSIRFSLPRAQRVRLDVIDLSGRRVATILDRDMQPGSKIVIWDGRSDAGPAAPSGSYLCRLSASGREETCRVSLVK